MSLTLQQMKILFKEGMDYAKENFSSLFYTFDEKLANYLLDLADKAPDMTTLFNVVFMASNVKAWSSMFTAPKLLPTGYELQHTGVQFGVGPVEWYFLFATATDADGKQYGVNITFFRLDIAPPHVIKKANLDPSTACCWGIMGGYGTNDSWIGIPSLKWFPMQYTETSYSTFILKGSEPQNNMNFVLQSIIPMQFDVLIEFNDSNNQKQSIRANMVATAPPQANFPYACQCGYGLGTMYYSYTDMLVNLSINAGANMSGQGWIDHQLIKGGIVDGLYMQASQLVADTLSKQKSGGWLWFALQDNQTGIQYMFLHKFGDKDFVDDIKPNKNIPLDIINVYKKGVPYFFSDAPSIRAEDTRVEMVESVEVPSLNLSLPTKYKITLPGGKKVFLKNFTQPNIYPCAFASYETPANLYDETGNIIGRGLIEANFYLDAHTMFKRYIEAAGGDPTNKKHLDLLLYANKQSGIRKFLAFIIFLIPLWIIIAGLVYILHKNDGERHKRAIVAIIVIIAAYMLITSISNAQFRNDYVYKVK